MKITQKKLLISLSFLSAILLSTGCAPKNSDGSYTSAYSYHPYLNASHNAERHTNNYNPSSNYITNNIENIAKSLLGTDYKYGANGPYQYDCSSFTKYVFSKQGINIPRVSREQAQRGQYIRANQLEKGDLIFFDSKKSEGISHVGIYLGKGDFIHASSVQDKVTISNLSSNYYSKHFKWGRRVTNVNYASR
jgi:cell wall-associated NlpC family hydrolase